MEINTSIKTKKSTLKRCIEYVKTYAQNCRYSFNMMLML